MKQSLLLLLLISPLAFGTEHQHHTKKHGSRSRSSRSSRSNIRRSWDGAKDAVKSLPAASVKNCDSLSASHNPPVQCQRGHHGQHLAQIFGNLCYALQAGFRKRECTVMSPHASSVRGHAHAQELVKKQPAHGDRHHSLTSSKSRRAAAAAKHGHWRSRALSHNTGSSSSGNGDHHRRAQFCIALYNPVTCLLEGVEFPSRCDAELAGYDAADCTAPTQPSATCPTTFSNAVLCANEQSFDNICLASEAGFIPSKDCVSANQPLFAETKCAGKRTKPVICGAEEREFANQCLARAAGFKKATCVKVPQDESV